MRGGSIQPLSIEHEVTVIADTYLVSAQNHQALDVELVLRQAVNSFGLENDDLAKGRFAEVVSDAIDEEMIAADDLDFDDVFAFFEFAGIDAAHAVGQIRASEHVFGREPNGVTLVTDHEALAQIEEQKFLWIFINH